MWSYDVPRKYLWERMSLTEITAAEAQAWFERLPLRMRLATLSPEYVCIDAWRGALTPTFLLFQEEGKPYFWLHSVHKGNVPGTDLCDFQSAYGYGGPLAFSLPDLDGDDDFSRIACMQYGRWCMDHGIVAEFVRFHPLLDQPWGGLKKPNRETVCLNVGERYGETCRNKLKKSKRSGVAVVHVDRKHIPAFAVDYRKGLERLKAERFYYFGDEYFRALAEWPKAHLLIAEVDGSWASAGIFLEGGDTLEYHLSTTNDLGRETAANVALLDAAHALARKKGLKRLYLGGGKTANQGDPLLEFKLSFLAERETRTFCVGEMIHKPDVYYALQESSCDVPPVSQKVLWWR